jgi:hypothetical protein
MLAGTWANDKRGMPVFWLHTAVRRGIWPSVDDQLGITPRASSDSSAYIFATQHAFQQFMSPFQAARRRKSGLVRLTPGGRAVLGVMGPAVDAHVPAGLARSWAVRGPGAGCIRWP